MAEAEAYVRRFNSSILFTYLPPRWQHTLQNGLVNWETRKDYIEKQLLPVFVASGQYNPAEPIVSISRDPSDDIKPCGRRGLSQLLYGAPVSGLAAREEEPTDMPRTYMDCAEYFFDGEFNVAKFRAGMVIYHGSGMLADANASHPLGKEFYDHNSDVLKVELDLKSQHIPSWYTVQYLASTHTSFFVPAGWFSNFLTAETYSKQQTGDSAEVLDNCKDKCIFAYKLVHDCVMIVLDDEYNLMKLMTGNLITDEDKTRLKNYWSLSDKFKLTGKLSPFHLVAYESMQRRSSREYDLPLLNNMCSGFLNRLGYAGCAYTTQRMAKTYYGTEIVFCNPAKWLERDYSDSRDWQHNPVLPPGTETTRLMELFGKYTTYNINDHAGNLFEHGIWTVLYAESLIKQLYGKHVDLTSAEFKTIVIAAWWHDIGKMQLPNTDIKSRDGKYVYFVVPDHPEIGANYVMSGSIPTESGTGINLSQVLLENGLDTSANRIIEIACYVLCHMHFGTFVLRDGGDYREYLLSMWRYADSLLKGGDLAKYLSPVKFWRGLVVVSLADALGANSYGIHRLRKKKRLMINKSSVALPYLANVGRVYHGGVEVARIANDKGRRVAKEIFKLLDTSGDSMAYQVGYVPPTRPRQPPVVAGMMEDSIGDPGVARILDLA